MTANPQTLVETAKLAFAVQRMDLGGYRHLPIVGPQGELAGIISARDILRHLTDTMAVEDQNG
jgi:CBS domain-containing protein